MSAGRLRQRIVFETLSATQDAFGAETATPSTLATVWGELRPLGGNELLRARQIQADVSHAIRIRWSQVTKAIVPKNRAKVGSRIFDIEAVTNDGERNRFLDILAVERV